MIRQVKSLTQKEYDLLVVGGGIFGICAAWDATLRGLSVALVERQDFANAASANCFKIVHGGIRYIQHGDIARIRESSRERTAFLRVAPHLVNPLPIIVPTYGHGLQSKQVLQVGMALYDAVTFDRNKNISDLERQIPSTHPISRQNCLELFPGLNKQGLTGGVQFHDGHIYSPSRLALSFLKSATEAGAEAANYVEATGFLRKENRISGITARDVLTGDRLEIRGKMVLNAAGPWAENLLQQGAVTGIERHLTFSRDVALVVNRRLAGNSGVAIQGGTKDPDAIVSRGNRHLFMVPWRDYTLIGVWHVVHQGDPDAITVTREDLQGFLDEFNAAYALSEPVKIEDVSMCNAGLVLFGDKQGSDTHLSYGKRSILVDHQREHGIEGLVTMIGVRFTTARGVGEKAVDLVCQKLGGKIPKSRTESTPVYGGNIENFDSYLASSVAQRPHRLNKEVMHGLLRNYGSSYGEVIGCAEENPSLFETLGNSNVTKAEVVHAVRNEMAQKLIDVVFRRTELGTGSNPGDEALQACADLMASEMTWDISRTQQELAEVKAQFPNFL